VSESETAWLIERDDLATLESRNKVCLHYYAEWGNGRHYWTPDHAKAKRFPDDVVARKTTNGDPLLRVAEHMWVTQP
jgi:pectin methylesterase-like acyl-CoA thioesterase